MNSRSGRRDQVMAEMGLGPVWNKRRQAANAVASQQPDLLAPVEGAPAMPVAAGASSAAIHLEAPPAGDVARMDWDALQQAVAGCVKCRLCETRSKTVFGVGDQKAKWMFIGEGPGRNEDLQGIPFVGPAGKLLDNMLLAMGLARTENAYIANVVKCRPTDENGRDRAPTPDEAGACMPYLQRQIELVRPAVLVALGKTAAVSLLELPHDSPVGKLRGQVFHYRDMPLVVTYHPAYLLRRLADKGKSWADLCLAMNAYAGQR